MEWNRETARHLLFRAGFGARPAEINAAVAKGLPGTVADLLGGPTRPLPAPTWLADAMAVKPRDLKEMDPDQRQSMRRESRQRLGELAAGWLEFMISAPTPADMLHEKMSFFWHGHFATSSRKVKAGPLIYRQIKLFHDHALGNYGGLLKAIIRDPAMLRYLDNIRNRKGNPNENLARELMELFSLGPGNYSEQDIKEGARALTGYSVIPYQFRFKRFQHDNGVKTILGQTGVFDGEDFVRIILDQPACAEFMTRKLWSHFAGSHLPPNVVDELASTFRRSDYDIRSLLTAMFRHPAFYSPAVTAGMIKSPVQLVVGTARTLDLDVAAPIFYLRMLMMMGELPYQPPNVKGWPAGRAWIDTSRLVTRYTFVEIVSKGQIPAEIDPRMESADRVTGPERRKRQRQARRAMRRMMGPLSLAISFDPQKLVNDNGAPGAIVDQLAAALLVVPPTPGERSAIVRELEAAIRTGSRHNALRQAIGSIMLLPQYQLH